MLGKKVIIFLFLVCSIVYAQKEKTYFLGSEYTALGANGASFNGVPSAFHINPATMASIKRNGFNSSFILSALNVPIGSVSYIQPFNSRTSFGSEFFFFSLGDQNNLNNFGLSQESFSYVEAELHLYLSFLWEKAFLQFGLDLENKYLKIAEVSSLTVDANIGILWMPGYLYFNESLFKQLTVGFSINNLLETGFHRLYSGNDTISRSYIFEVSQKISPLNWLSVKVPLGFELNENWKDYSAGLELGFKEMLFLRAGYSQQYQLNYGFGLQYKKMQLNYSLKQTELGINHSASFSSQFGFNILEKEKEQLEKIERDVEKRMDQQITQVQAMTEEKISTINIEMSNTISNIIMSNQLRLAALENEIKQEFSGQMTQLETEVFRASQRAEVLRRQNSDLSNRLQSEIDSLEQEYETEIEQIRTTSEQSKTQYSRAMQAFSLGRMDEAETLLKELQEKNPEDPEVIKYIRIVENSKKDVQEYDENLLNDYREGMKHFLKQDYNRAIQIWEQILEEDPYNHLAIQGIERAKKKQNR